MIFPPSRANICQKLGRLVMMSPKWESRMTSRIQAVQRGLVESSERTKLRVTGSDRLRFLNGQITNDVRKATDTVAIEACVLKAKGRINAHIFVSAAPDCYFVDADPEIREALLARLERYVIADDVQI